MNMEPQDQSPVEPNRYWEQPTVQELLVQQTAFLGGPGPDGGPFADCTRS